MNHPAEPEDITVMDDRMDIIQNAKNRTAILELAQHYRTITIDDLKAALCNLCDEDLDYWANFFTDQDEKGRPVEYRWMQLALFYLTGFHTPLCKICDTVKWDEVVHKNANFPRCHQCHLHVEAKFAAEAPYPSKILTCESRREYKDLLEAETFGEMKAAMTRAADLMEELCRK